MKLNRSLFLALAIFAASCASHAPQPSHAAPRAASARDSSPAYYEDLWRTMRVLPGWESRADVEADFAIANRVRYEAVEAKTGVPWPVVAVIHRLEGAADWRTCLHNGERIIGTGKKTKLVPAGRGPFATWEAAAVDALGQHRHGWALGECLRFLEIDYNGAGYRNRGKASPYLWSGSNHGVGIGKVLRKYVGDGRYDPKAVSKQVGAALILRAIVDRGAWTPVFSGQDGPGEAPAPPVGKDALPLRHGSEGPRVAVLQGALNEIGGFGLKKDGKFGPKTAATLRLAVKVD